jgi:hypothetical protein
MKDLQNEARYMHDQLEEMYNEFNFDKNFVIMEEQNKTQKIVVIGATIILAIVILIV